MLNKALIRYKDIKDDYVSESAMARAVRNFVEQGSLVKIKNGLYAMVNPITSDIFANRFEIATALYDDCCVAYHSALEFHGLGNQMYSEVQVVAPKRYQPFKFNGLTYRFFALNCDQGFMSLEQNDLIRVTELERTAIDCIDRIDLAGGIEELITALNGITYLDEKKLTKYLHSIDKKFLYKKVGYFFQTVKATYVSESFIAKCKENASTRVDDITENKKLSRRLNTEWNLIVPQTLINTEN